MRLATDELKQAILHADQAVRQAIVFYFAHSFTPDATILPLVIEVIERYGRAEAFSTRLWRTCRSAMIRCPGC